MSGEHHETDSPRAGPTEYERWLNLILWILVALCAFWVAVDLFIHRHAHWSWEERSGFYGVFGFVAFWCIVIAGKHLRKVLMRDEDYYDV